MTDPRRRLPQVDQVARALEADAGGLPRPVVVAAARATLEAMRKQARRGQPVPPESEVLAAARAELARRRRSLLAGVINATGVVVHTNLGRAPLSQAAIATMATVASGYSNLEFDLETGKRGDRYEHVEPLVALATGAQAALVVNNNAAAVLLVCAALARGSEVVISRGELIEIGGEFRIPDVLAESGAILREIGTTNRTHLRDYERAIGPDTALVLKVHPSNYRVVGFTKAPASEEIAALTRKARIPLVHDVGSGLLGATIADEPPVDAALRAGADLVTFSGDKLLGGPQAGLVVGRRDLVARLRRHPLVRALRPDKMTIAALQETVAAYLDGRRDELPVWGMLTASPERLRARCRKIAARLRKAGLNADVVEASSVAGGGSLPGHDLPSAAVRVRAGSARSLAERLRLGSPPVVGRVEDRALLLDLRTVDPSDDARLARAVIAAAGS